MIDDSLIILGVLVCIFKLISKGTVINIFGTVNYFNKDDESHKEADKVLNQVGRKILK